VKEVFFISVSIQERIGGPLEKEQALMDNIASRIRVAMPGIVESFDPANQTAVVRLAIRESIRNKDTRTVDNVEIPLLLDVPVQIPRAGGYCITLPVKPGDECLVVFGDMCFDAWWAGGGVQNQMEKRRHDLSDAFAIVGITSQPRKLTNYPADRMTLRSERGSALLEISQDVISLSADSINISAAKTINISAPDNPDGVVNIVGWTASLTQLKP
jgi:hypothetical protein